MAPRQTKVKTGEFIRDAASRGGLLQCMVDANPDGLRWARRLRRRAFIVSAILQASCVAALLIWPLIAAPHTLPHLYFVTPVPPYRGSAGAPRPRVQHFVTHRARFSVNHPLVFPTAVRHAAVREEGDFAPGPTGPSVDIGIISSDQGFGIPSGIGTAVRVQPPRPAPSTRTVVHRGEGVMQGQLVHRIQPQYPQIARDLHLSGTVHLQATIGMDGTIGSLEVLDGNPILVQAAIEAVREWRYRPTLLNGVPVEVETSITVRFVLSD